MSITFQASERGRAILVIVASSAIASLDGTEDPLRPRQRFDPVAAYSRSPPPSARTPV